MIQTQNHISHGWNLRSEFGRWRPLRRCISVGLILAGVSFAQQDRSRPINEAGDVDAWTLGIKGYVPPNGFIADQQTALKVADAILVGVYGEKQIATERPLKVAPVKHDVWLVWGTVPKNLVGGAAVIKLSKKSGRVLFLTHAQ